MVSYLLSSLTVIAFCLVTLIYLTRAHWLRFIPSVESLPYPLNFRYDPISASGGASSSFADDAASGMHSSTFDLSANIESGDGRKGLDERAKKEIQRIMKRRNVGFDEARRIVVMERFRREGVGEDGRPRDPKFVSFS